MPNRGDICKGNGRRTVRPPSNNVLARKKKGDWNHPADRGGKEKKLPEERRKKEGKNFERNV